MKVSAPGDGEGSCEGGGQYCGEGGGERGGGTRELGESGEVGLPFVQAGKKLMARQEAKKTIRTLDRIIKSAERGVLNSRLEYSTVVRVLSIPSAVLERFRNPL
jgi:hypothetical protein